TRRALGASHAHDDRGVPSSRRDAPQIPISGQKGATGVPPFNGGKGNCGSEKGELAFQKRGTPVPPTLFNESIYDPPEISSTRQRAQISPIGFDEFWRAYIRGRLIEVKLYGPSQGPSKTRRSRKQEASGQRVWQAGASTNDACSHLCKILD